MDEVTFGSNFCRSYTSIKYFGWTDGLKSDLGEGQCSMCFPPIQGNCISPCGELTSNEVSSILVTIGLVFSEGIKIKDINDKKPEKDNAEEVHVSSDRGPGDDLKAEEKDSKAGETPPELHPRPKS
ncbi:MAG: hypothetical protein JRI46_04050 [Deltaproteobacteria bacterium]|nr:hypothetical protein [Deltaproteobacteria bacterium]